MVSVVLARFLIKILAYCPLKLLLALGSIVVSQKKQLHKVSKQGENRVQNLSSWPKELLI